MWVLCKILQILWISKTGNEEVSRRAGIDHKTICTIKLRNGKQDWMKTGMKGKQEVCQFWDGTRVCSAV